MEDDFKGWSRKTINFFTQRNEFGQVKYEMKATYELVDLQLKVGHTNKWIKLMKGR